MNQHLAKDVANMIPNDDPVVGEDNWAMADEGRAYLPYLKNGGEAKVDVSGAQGQKFSVSWFDPRTGGDLIDGSPLTVIGGPKNVLLGMPPNFPESDWVVLLKNIANTKARRKSPRP